MEETFNIIVGTVAITLLIVMLLYGLYSVLKKVEDPDMEERHRMTMKNLKVFELTDMVRVTTMTGEEIAITQELYNKQDYIIKLEDGTVINKSAIEKVHYYSIGYGVLSRKVNGYGGKTEILVKLKAGVDKQIHTLEVCRRNKEEYRPFHDRVVAEVCEDGTLNWYKTF